MLRSIYRSRGFETEELLTLSDPNATGPIMSFAEAMRSQRAR